MALANGISRMTTSSITKHLSTNAEVIHRFLPARIEISGEVGQPGNIRVNPEPVTA
jgi:RNA 3'-terminal phosphate cyclase (ATP)